MSDQNTSCLISIISTYILKCINWPRWRKAGCEGSIHQDQRSLFHNEVNLIRRGLPKEWLLKWEQENRNWCLERSGGGDKHFRGIKDAKEEEMYEYPSSLFFFRKGGNRVLQFHFKFIYQSVSS